jgi:hypothetical protein
MLSAFGVDHGEIAKGFRSPRWGKPPPRPFRGGPTAAGDTVRGAFKRVTEANVSLKGIGESAGKAAGKTGSFLEKHPGITGTALVGGGGALGYKALKKEPRKKKS